jgi:hypothetical protein
MYNIVSHEEETTSKAKCYIAKQDESVDLGFLRLKFRVAHIHKKLLY